MEVYIIPIETNRLRSSDFALQCIGSQYPWNATLVSAGWYDARGSPITKSSNSGAVSIDVIQNMYNPSILNLTYTFRSQLSFNRPLSVSDGNLYVCNISVNITYPDNYSHAILSNFTQFPLIIDGNPCRT